MSSKLQNKNKKKFLQNVVSSNSTEVHSSSMPEFGRCLIDISQRNSAEQNSEEIMCKLYQTYPISSRIQMLKNLRKIIKVEKPLVPNLYQNPKKQSFRWIPAEFAGIREVSTESLRTNNDYKNVNKLYISNIEFNDAYHFRPIQPSEIREILQ